jgi:uncharacterized protein
MPVSLHTVTVGTFLQILPSIAGLVDKAEEHCTANGLPTEALTDAKLAPDMWPFAKQVMLCTYHSAGAIAAVRAGVFSPDITPAPLDFPSLRQGIADALAELKAVDPAELDGLIGRDMRFEFRTHRMDFTVEDFLLTFTLPNFYFHATTAYGVLRSQGLAIGKMDFIGAIRLKG